MRVAQLVAALEAVGIAAAGPLHNHHRHTHLHHLHRRSDNTTLSNNTLTDAVNSTVFADHIKVVTSTVNASPDVSDGTDSSSSSLDAAVSTSSNASIVSEATTAQSETAYPTLSLSSDVSYASGSPSNASALNIVSAIPSNASISVVVAAAATTPTAVGALSQSVDTTTHVSVDTVYNTFTVNGAVTTASASEKTVTVTDVVTNFVTATFSALTPFKNPVMRVAAVSSGSSCPAVKTTIVYLPASVSPTLVAGGAATSKASSVVSKATSSRYVSTSALKSSSAVKKSSTSSSSKKTSTSAAKKAVSSSSSKKPTSTKKSSSSVKKSSSSTKKTSVSSKKATTSSVKKATTSSVKKATTTSSVKKATTSSVKKATTSSVKKATTSSKKATTSSKKASTSSKKATTSSKKATTSSKKASTTLLTLSSLAQKGVTVRSSASAISQPSSSSIKASSSAKASSSVCSAVVPPAATQTGIVSGCTKWVTAQKGDYCNKIAQANGLSTDTFMSWNPAVNAPACDSLWVGYAYCVATSCGSSAATPATAAATSKAATAAANSNKATSTSTPSSTAIASSAYKMYTGNGTVEAGWPSQNQWIDFDTMFTGNIPIMKQSCGNNNWGNNDSDDEIADIKSAILKISASSNVDPRFILAIIMQESNGCVRVVTTSWSVQNPGLMQDHAGTGTCNSGGVIQDPCPYSEIEQMIKDGTQGTASGDGLVQVLQQAEVEDVSKYYRAARIYNGGAGGYNADDLGTGCCTLCYSSDVANRLTGWNTGVTGCTLKL